MAFRKYLIGVVSHGGFQDRSSKASGVPWALQMGRSLRAQGYDLVIPYNWVAESRTPGAAAKQGPASRGSSSSPRATPPRGSRWTCTSSGIAKARWSTASGFALGEE